MEKNKEKKEKEKNKKEFRGSLNRQLACQLSLKNKKVLLRNFKHLLAVKIILKKTRDVRFPSHFSKNHREKMHHNVGESKANFWETFNESSKPALEYTTHRLLASKTALAIFEKFASGICMNSLAALQTQKIIMMTENLITC